MRLLSVGFPEPIEVRLAALGTVVGVLAIALEGGKALATDCRMRSRLPLSLSESESDAATKRLRPLP